MKRLIGLMFMLGAMVSGELFAMSRTEDRSIVLILMGPPGSGKGTHALPLSEQLHLPHISTGDLFREHIRNDTALGKEAKKYIDLGHLVPDRVVLDMLFERVSQLDCRHGYILDGFPRTLAQAEELQKRLDSRHKVIALNLQVTDKAILERITGRVVCSDCSRSFHLHFNPPETPGVCNACGGTLYQRDDDQEQVVCKRLSVYRTQTEPLIAYYRGQDVLKEINSEQSKDIVFQEVLDAVSALFFVPTNR